MIGVYNCAPLRVAIGAFQHQTETVLGHKRMCVPPISVAHQARVMDVQFGSLKEALCAKAAVHDLQWQKTGGVASVKQQHIWQRGPKA